MAIPPVKQGELPEGAVCMVNLLVKVVFKRSQKVFSGYELDNKKSYTEAMVMEVVPGQEFVFDADSHSPIFIGEIDSPKKTKKKLP